MNLLDFSLLLRILIKPISLAKLALLRYITVRGPAKHDDENRSTHKI